MYSVGTSKTDITPPVGFLLQGHAARKGLSDGVHDPLLLNVITIADGRNRVVIVTSSLVYFAPAFIAALQHDVYKRLKIHPSDLLITAVHTHTGPYLLPSNTKDPRKMIPDYINCLRLKIVGGIIEAIKNEEKAELYYGSGSANIGVINRRLKTKKGVMMMPNPQGPVDYQVSVLGVRSVNGTPKAILTNYACHPTTIGTKIYQVSADYPGAYQRVIERVYPSAVACFTNGCCGDVRPAIIAGDQFKGGTFDDVERMGSILAGEVIKTFEQARPVQRGKVEGVLKSVKLPLDKTLIPSSASQVAALAARHARCTTLDIRHEDVQGWKQYWRQRLGKRLPIQTFVPFDVHALKIGNFRMIGLTGEIMVGIGLKIKARAADIPLMVCSCVNAPIGYIPTADALVDGGYETASFLWKKYAAPFAPGMEEILVKEAVNLL